MAEQPEGGATELQGVPGRPGVDVWPRLASDVLGDFEIFRVRRDRVRSPRTGAVLERHVLEVPDWVNVVPVTRDGRIVLVEQFRHGTRAVTIELPAGIVEPGEDPCVAGLRELEEETGYRAAAGRLLGFVEPNPALQDNRSAVVLAEGCVPDGRAAPDEGEDVRVRVVEPATVRELIARGVIRHAITIAAWYRYELWAAGLG
ncbi:MAG: NUDIX hydrolase [bacterium]|nr:MAG: NUDIX hydrolase [bacterium]